jgi:hypothetical protein
LLILVIAAASAKGNHRRRRKLSNSCGVGADDFGDDAVPTAHKLRSSSRQPQLVSDYEANQVAADAKYKGQTLQVSGTVDEHRYGHPE